VQPAKDLNDGSEEARWALAAWREHLHENVCKGNAEYARWVTAFFAQMVQRPWEKPLVGLVLQGDKGVGKNALIEQGPHRLLGAHSLIVTDPRYLAGNFNGHLENLLLFTLDEAFWSGDKKVRGILQGLITGASHNIEHKGQEPYTVDNLLRVVVIGNDDWLVQASNAERRYSVLEVGNGRRQDRAFFERMRKGMDAGGDRLLLRYLLDFDLSGVEINKALDTDALREQKAYSRGLAEEFIDEMLEHAEVPGEFPMPYPDTGLNIFGLKTLPAAFERWARRNGNGADKVREQRRKLNTLLMKALPASYDPKPTKLKNNTQHVAFGPLAQARKEWETYCNGAAKPDYREIFQ